MTLTLYHSVIWISHIVLLIVDIFFRHTSAMLCGMWIYVFLFSDKWKTGSKNKFGTFSGVEDNEKLYFCHFFVSVLSPPCLICIPALHCTINYYCVKSVCSFLLRQLNKRIFSVFKIGNSDEDTVIDYCENGSQT